MKYVAFGLAIAVIGWIFFDNKRIKISRYNVASKRLPKHFSGFKIAQISDLHGAHFGKENRRLLALIREEKPDIIVITGDIINSRKVNIPAAEKFCRAAGEMAPVFFASGNHESRLNDYAELRKTLENAGVTVLENQSAVIRKNNESITLSGVTDPRFVTDYDYNNSLSALRKALANMSLNQAEFNVLLSHRPELMAAYVECGADLVFSGHAHGGQFRLPLLGGIYVPGQGFFPHYDAGSFSEGETRMIVSRGLGQSIIPFRIGNPPELVIAELTK